MTIPKEIAEKVAEYEEHSRKAELLCEELIKWFKENHSYDCSYESFSIEEEPSGDNQHTDDGEEYCDQSCHGEDCYSGNYYIAIEGSTKYVCYGYWC